MQGLGHYSKAEVTSIILAYLDEALDEVDIEVKKIAIVGSRLYGHFHPDSDLDIVMEYGGPEREENVFHYLMEEPLYIDHIKVDFLPFWEVKGNGIGNRVHVVLYDES